MQKIVIADKKPRKIQIQPEVIMKSKEDLQYIDYDSNSIGAIHSHLQHYADLDTKDLLEEYRKNKPFRY